MLRPPGLRRSCCWLLLGVGFLSLAFAFQRPLHPPSPSSFVSQRHYTFLHLVPKTAHKYQKYQNNNLLQTGVLPRVNDDEEEYNDKLANLNKAIEAAEAEREKLLRARQDKKLEKSEKEEVTGVSWAGWNNEESPELVSVDEWRGGELRQPPAPSFSTRSKVTHTDAGTLVIEITPEGITSGVLFNGAFSVAWFSAIVPATVTALSGGLLGVALFMVPFWAAGGFVAKQAVLDPFVSSRVSIGQFAWSVESRLGGKKTAASISKQDGSTEDLRGARVECNLVVNEKPQFQLCLYSSNGVTKLGLGLPEEELEKVASEINDYLASISKQDRTNALKAWPEISDYQ